MTTENYLYIIGAGLGAFILASSFFVYPFVVGKLKKVAYPYQFAFISGGVAVGIQALLTIIAIPIIVFSTFALPGYCKDNLNSYVCEIAAIIRDFFPYIELGLIVLITAVVPFKLLKKAWPAYEAGKKLTN